MPPQMPSPGQKFLAFIPRTGEWQQRTMERYWAAGFDDDHGFEHRQDGYGRTWRESPFPDAKADCDVCGSAGEVFCGQDSGGFDRMEPCPACLGKSEKVPTKSKPGIALGIVRAYAIAYAETPTTLAWRELISAVKDYGKACASEGASP